MMVRFEDTDPRPLPNGNMPCAIEPIFAPSRGIQRRGDVSPGFVRQRAERQRAADAASKPDRLEELGRGLAALVSPHKPPPPEGYAEVVAEANRRAAGLFVMPDYARIYVAGFVDHWLSERIPK